ncbi:hypothetical protein ACFVGM_09045 [Kitasatospora purpeofusca]|uniref:hypothetical protein n=1 Tax=Kitasatospora purpeofusca TaxID=67352 RepID=UPI0036ADEE56
MTEDEPVLPPYARAVIAESTLRSATGVEVLVRTIHESWNPHEVSGCSCHRPGARYGSVIVWPADGSPREVCQYEERDEAERGHADIVAAIESDRLRVINGMRGLLLLGDCGHYGYAGFPSREPAPMLSVAELRKHLAVENCRVCAAQEAVRHRQA